MNTLGMATLALLLESLFGYPDFLQKHIGHPVEWIGKLIAFLDDGLNDAEADARSQRINGVIALACVLMCCVLPALFIQWALAHVAYGWLVNVLLASTLLAQHSLVAHVQAVAEALPRSLDEARTAVSKIVGRDPSRLDSSGIAKAALESLAENASDGVVAPFLWYALLGLPGLVAYKAINTADSMIGHKSEKYLNFGWASAKLDDLVNLPASRFAGLLFAAAARLDGEAAMKKSWRAMMRDAAKHNSPNAGWPEAAMAGALGFSFGGARDYDGETMQLPVMGDGRAPQDAKDINAGVSLFRVAMLFLGVGSAFLAFAL